MSRRWERLSIENPFSVHRKGIQVEIGLKDEQHLTVCHSGLMVHNTAESVIGDIRMITKKQDFQRMIDCGYKEFKVFGELEPWAYIIIQNNPYLKVSVIGGKTLALLGGETRVIVDGEERLSYFKK